MALTLSQMDRAARAEAERDELQRLNEDLTAEIEQLSRDYADACAEADAWMTRYGDLSEEFRAYRAKADVWRRQVGGGGAATRRLKQRIRELEAENAKLVERGAYYRAAFEDMMGHPLEKLEEVTG